MVSMQPITADLAQALGLPSTKGAVVARVSPGSPAAAADLKQNDVIVTFDGTVVDDYHHVQRLAADAEVGKTVKLDIIRDRAKRSVSLKITEAPDSAYSSCRFLDDQSADGDRPFREVDPVRTAGRDRPLLCIAQLAELRGSVAETVE